MTNINQIDCLKVFVHVVEKQSFTKAAASLNRSTSWVSKMITRLESTLGAQLLNRTTRQLHPTITGQSCYTQALELIQMWENLAENVARSESSVTGTLRVSAPMSWGLANLSPIIDSFTARYPKVHFDIELGDHKVDVVGEKFDIVLRISSSLEDSSLLSRRIFSYRRIICASPEMKINMGDAASICNINEHRPLLYRISSSSPKWVLHKDGIRHEVKIDPYLVSNNSLLLKQYLISGKGIALLPEFLIKDELENGSIVEIFSEYTADNLNLYSLRPSGRKCTNKVAIFQDFIANWFNGMHRDDD